MNIRLLYQNMGEMGTQENFIKILETIAPYVVVTGSYACGSPLECSDINFYIKRLPEEKIIKKMLPEITEDTYLYALLRFFTDMGYKWQSSFFQSFEINGTFIPLSFSTHYSISEEVFDINIMGVTLAAAKPFSYKEKGESL